MEYNPLMDQGGIRYILNSDLGFVDTYLKEKIFSNIKEYYNKPCASYFL
jgi:hypothetical protein